MSGVYKLHRNTRFYIPIKLSCNELWPKEFDQQFLVVFMRCGTSDMKYTKRFSILYGLRTLNVTSSSDLDSDRCMRKNFRLTDALSPVSEITLKPAHSRFLTTSQAIGCRSSADRSVVGYWAYGNWRLIKIPRTINTSMCFATVRSAAPFMDFSKASSALFTSPN